MNVEHISDHIFNIYFLILASKISLIVDESGTLKKIKKFVRKKLEKRFSFFFCIIGSESGMKKGEKLK